jgi:hypothetical protein
MVARINATLALCSEVIAEQAAALTETAQAHGGPARRTALIDHQQSIVRFLAVSMFHRSSLVMF